MVEAVFIPALVLKVSFLWKPVGEMGDLGAKFGKK